MKYYWGRLTDKLLCGTTSALSMRSRSGVRIVATIGDLLRWVRQQARAWRARLRRDWTAIALLVLFSLSLAEPLACIIHCQIWLPLAFHDYFAAQHQHHHHAHQFVRQTSDPTPTNTA